MVEDEIKDETEAALQQTRLVWSTNTNDDSHAGVQPRGPEDQVLDKVQLRWLKLKTRPYFPLVTRCYRCQGYGHVAWYKPKDVCPVCAGSHKFDACPTKDLKKCTHFKGDHGSRFKDCPRYIEAKATVRAAEENTSYCDALINMRKDEREDKKRATTLDQPSETASTSTAPRKTTLDDDTWPTISNNRYNTSRHRNTGRHRNTSRPSVARIAQSKRTLIDRRSSQHRREFSEISRA